MPQQRAVMAKGWGAQSGVILREEIGGAFVLFGVNVENVVPELGDPLAQLGRGKLRADQAGGDHLLRGADALFSAVGAFPIEQMQPRLGWFCPGGQAKHLIARRPGTNLSGIASVLHQPKPRLWQKAGQIVQVSSHGSNGCDSRSSSQPAGQLARWRQARPQSWAGSAAGQALHPQPMQGAPSTPATSQRQFGKHNQWDDRADMLVREP